MKRAYWKIALALTVIFVAGMGAGVSVTKRVAVKRSAMSAKPEGWSVSMLQRMDERLKLSEEQKAAIRPLLRETAQTLQGQRRRAMMESWQTVRGFYEAVDQHLTEEQRGELLRHRQKLREKLQEANERRPGVIIPLRPVPAPANRPAMPPVKRPMPTQP